MATSGQGLTADTDAVEASVVAFLRTVAGGTDGDALAAAMVDVLLAPWAARQASVFLLDPTGSHLEAVGHHGLTEEERAGYSRLEAGLDLPVADVARRGVDSWIAVAETAARYPALSDWAHGQPDRDTAEVLVTPLRSAGRLVGALAVLFSQRPERSWDLRAAVEAAVSTAVIWANPGPAQPARSRLRRRDALVTPRQQRILALVREGLSNAEIAAELGCSVGTVKAELARVFRVLGASDREEAARLAEQAGM